MAGTKGFYIGLMFEQAAVRHGDASVVLDQALHLSPQDGTGLTVGRLARIVRETAGRLLTAGVARGDHVAVYKSNNFDIALLASAAQRIGAVPALLSPALPGATASRLLERLDRPWLLTDRAALDREGLETSAARRVLVVAGDTPRGSVALSDLDVSPLAGTSVVGPDEPAFISHTSGTTGLPKLVVQTPDALWQRLRLQKLVAAGTWRRESVALCVSFVHARFYSALDLGISHGHPLLVAVDDSPAAIGELFARHRPGAVETQPNTFIDWEVLAQAPGRPLSSIRYFSATFDAMHPRTIQTLLGASRRHRPLFIQLYGQSETGPVTGTWYSVRSAGSMDGRRVGRPLPGVIRIRVTDEAGRPVRTGVVGHLEVRSRTRALTYLGEDQRFARNLNGGWWRMGDMGFLDRLGRAHLLDREIDQVASIGSSLQLEDELMDRLPELREIIVVPGADGRAVPVVCTRDDAPLDPERWSGAVAALPAMAPVRQLPFAQVPRTSTWKVRRPELIELLARDDAHA